MGRGLALIAACALGLFGCGGGPTFTASQFVDKVNSEGAPMELGRRLPTNGDAQEIYLVRLPPGASGTLYVYGGTGSAEDRFSACQRSGGLLCYRAQNIVVVLENGGLEASRLAVAMQRLASK